MNLSTKKLSFVIIAAAIAFAGCSKKPKRPSPEQTMIGPNGLDSTPINGIGGEGAAPGTGLDARSDGSNPANGDRTVLASHTIYFDFDQSGIKASERPKLDAVKAFIAEHPEARVLLEGHCDWKGTAEYNLGLGDRRSNAAKQYLTTSGVTADKLEVLSKGDLDAIENSDEATAAKDRRVDFVVLKQ